MGIRTRCDLVVHGDFVLPMTGGLPVLRGHAVVVTDGEVVAVAPSRTVEANHEAAETLRGGIVLPGLVNTHGHAGMTLYRGSGDDLPLDRWLREVVWPAEKQFTTPENVALGTRLAVAEMLASGTTTFTDMYFHQEAVAETCDETGIRVRLGQAVIGFPTPDAPDTGTSMARAEALARRWADHPRIDVSLALHAVYTLSPEQLRAGAEFAERAGLPIQIHCSETRKEVEDCRGAHGRTPPKLLHDTGVLRPGTVCAHGVHLTDTDRVLIRDSGAGVSLNPESNLKLGSGVPDVAALLQDDVPLGLGTDGAASNNDLDLFDAIRLTALLPKGTGEDPEAVPARAAVDLATRGGARLLGLGTVIGRLEPGMRADLCVVDTAAPHLTPIYDPYSHLAYAVRGSDVLHTVVDGRVLYQDRHHTTIDVPTLIEEVSALSQSISAALRNL